MGAIAISLGGVLPSAFAADAGAVLVVAVAAALAVAARARVTPREEQGGGDSVRPTALVRNGATDTGATRVLIVGALAAGVRSPR